MSSHGASARAYFYNNKQQAPGDQVLGVKTTSGVVHNWFSAHSGITLVALLGVIGFVTVALTLGLTLGLRHDSSQSADYLSSMTPPSPGSTPPDTNTLSVTPTSPSSQTTSTSTYPMTTSQALQNPCTHGCLQSFQETSGCVAMCPGATCFDDTGCMDPYPCIGSVCCYTGCLDSWTCNGECSGSLKCVSDVTGTAESTCQP
ncbi:hypothetical protein HD806DRAFT_522345 [Xylariaceae sp. AK1471]|nr:hypothetical protein HD806DRAFT_522345 [Xylariaceae sp. AK1471]